MVLKIISEAAKRAGYIGTDNFKTYKIFVQKMNKNVNNSRVRSDSKTARAEYPPEGEGDRDEEELSQEQREDRRKVMKARARDLERKMKKKREKVLSLAYLTIFFSSSISIRKRNRLRMLVPILQPKLEVKTNKAKRTPLNLKQKKTPLCAERVVLQKALVPKRRPQNDQPEKVCHPLARKPQASPLGANPEAHLHEVKQTRG